MFTPRLFWALQLDIGRETALKDGLVANKFAVLDLARVELVVRPENASNAEKVCSAASGCMGLVS